MIDAVRFQVGEAYYMPTYPDPTMVMPIVLTYVYLGQDLDLLLDGGSPLCGSQESKDSQRPHHYFRFMPPFQYDPTPQARDAWQEAFPDLFSGWGDTVPSVFYPNQLTGLMTLGELIEGLKRCHDRRGMSGSCHILA